MDTPSVLRLPHLPFHIGAQDKPINRRGLPNTAPFECAYNPELQALVQIQTDEVDALLARAYLIGDQIGTPLNDGIMGRQYVDDFLEFIKTHGPKVPGRSLEIGAGVGYLTHRLTTLGWDAVGLEPGFGYENEQLRHRARIYKAAFPSNLTDGQFDLIANFAVLEHLNDPVKMLSTMAKQLSPEGTIVVAVPDCTEEIESGDPGILIHEHMTYFTRQSLEVAFEKAGLQSIIVKSKHGRLLYAAARPTQTSSVETVDRISDTASQTYPQRAQQRINVVREALEDLVGRGTLGIFVPARGFSFLDPSWRLRFFDDDPALHGKFYPPFQWRIESRTDLEKAPVDTLVVLSRTFGHRIREVLVTSGYRGKILSVEEL